MKFTKPSVSIADQISLLEGRGLSVPDHARVGKFNKKELREIYGELEQPILFRHPCRHSLNTRRR